MNKLTAILMILLAGAVYAQAPATAPTPVKPAEKTTPAPDKVTPLESAGLQKIQNDYQTVLQELSQANIDVAKNHPGFHLDPKNPLSGILVKDEDAGKTPFNVEKPHKSPEAAAAEKK